MDNVSIQPPENLGKNFIPAEFLSAGRDEYYLRNSQNSRPQDRRRGLNAKERAALIKNGNIAANWDEVFVAEEFDPGLIVNTRFAGLVRIGRLRKVVLEHHGLQLPAGIGNSFVVACDIGDDAAIYNAAYLAHYIIGDRCILANIGQMLTTNCAQFGNGILKDGLTEDARLRIDIMNEAGLRPIMPFDGMIAADAYLWAKYRDDKPLMEKFKQITQKRFDSRRGFYGTTGDQCVIRNCRNIRNVKIGPHCRISGANKLKNLTINSSQRQPTRIGEGVEMTDGIVGSGCNVSGGCRAERFVLGDNSNLTCGAKFIDSLLGENSTVSCCEVRNSLILAGHQQHHNNSFLIAALVMGQSNIAAGATIGSNHNSRANDNEIQAARGFWPGLCASLKHSSRFASFTLAATGDYPAQLDIPLPFALLNNNAAKDRLEVTPAFWWLFNMYALVRNEAKFQSRDKRVDKVQNIEFESLAPDTAEEILNARRLLENCTAKAYLRQTGKNEIAPEQNLSQIGKDLLAGPPEVIDGLEVIGEDMEKSRRKVVILKVWQGYRAYEQMLLYYAVKNLLAFLQARGREGNFASMKQALKGPRQNTWVNLGGQLVQGCDVDLLRADAAAGKLDSWDDIHGRYDRLWREYPLQKQKHAFAALCELYQRADITAEQWLDALDRAAKIQRHICDQAYLSRKKDFDSPFQQAVFRNKDEMTAVVGTAENDSFIKLLRRQSEEFVDFAAEAAKRG